MYAAILHEGNVEKMINADEYHDRFGARGGRSTWLTCPQCGQPVVARGMTPGSMVSPYFKHENDNPAAWACPDYRAGDGSYGGDYGAGAATPLGEPIDMYIEYEGEHVFNLLVGFPGIEPWALELLEAQGAMISFGLDEYPVDAAHFSCYNDLYYTVDGPSFGLGLKLRGAEWPYSTPMPNIEHTLNGCMLFGFPRESNLLCERLNARNIDQYVGNRFHLAYSTVSGMLPATLIKATATSFKVMGSLTNSWDGEDEIRVAKFNTQNRDLLKILFP